MDDSFFLDTVEMNSSNNGPPTSISPEERAELNAAMKARLNAVRARGPVAKVGDIIRRKDGVLGVIEDIRNADDYYVRLNDQNENDDYKIFHSNNFGTSISIVPPETLNTHHKEKARIAIKKANNSRKTKRRANISARQVALGLTPGKIVFNPVAIAQNKETHPLGPNNGPKRTDPREIVEGAFSHKKPGYTGNFNSSVAKNLGSLWQTSAERMAARSSFTNQAPERPLLRPIVPLKPRVSSWWSSIFGNNKPPPYEILSPNERNTGPAHVRGKKLHEELYGEGTSGGRRATGRKQKTRKSRK